MATLEEKIKEVYNQPLTCLRKENAPLTTKVLKIFREENLNVSNALRVLKECEDVVQKIATI